MPLSDLLLPRGVENLLKNQPKLSIKYIDNDGITIIGIYSFNASFQETEISDSYHLKILIPEAFPKAAPQVWEMDGKITQDISNNHLFDDKSLCLGSPIQINVHLLQFPDIYEFSQKFILPYLFAISHRIKNGGSMIFGELKHGFDGVVEDAFPLPNRTSLDEWLNLINKKKRVANKRPCPCGCGKRLGVCRYHYWVNYFRKLKYSPRKKSS